MATPPVKSRTASIAAKTTSSRTASTRTRTVAPKTTRTPMSKLKPKTRRKARPKIEASHEPPVRFAGDDYARARRWLMKRDPRLAEIMKRVGSCRMAAYLRGDTFSALVESIVSQQLSVKAAETIYGRIRKLVEPDEHVSPANVLALTPDQLRGAGLSRAKAMFVHDLAQKITDRTLVLEELEHLTDEAVIRALSQVKGIGRWSAQMFLIFRLNRPDVWPIGDLGIVRALERFHGLRKTPTLHRLHKMGDDWRPYRSVAAWYLWHNTA